MPFIQQLDPKTVIISFAVLGLSIYCLQHLMNKISIPTIENVNTDIIEDVKILFEEEDYKPLLKSLYNMALDNIPELITKGNIKSNEDKLIFYSLYKQIEYGDALKQEGVPKNAKYYAWKQ